MYYENQLQELTSCVERLNEQVGECLGEDYGKVLTSDFTLIYTQWYWAITFCDHVLVNSEYEGFESEDYDEETDTYKPLYDIVKRQFSKWISEVKRIKL